MTQSTRLSVLVEKMRLVYLASKALSDEFNRMDDATLHDLLTQYDYESSSIQSIQEFATCVELMRQRGSHVFDISAATCDTVG